MAHVQSYDHLITRAILSHYLATLAFIVQQSHINARPIARFNAFASQNGRLRSCDRCATTFSYAIISATVYDPNLNFSIARLFGRFWSCANCERAFMCNWDLNISLWLQSLKVSWLYLQWSNVCIFPSLNHSKIFELFPNEPLSKRSSVVGQITCD